MNNIKIPEIPEEDRNPTVVSLLNAIRQLLIHQQWKQA